MKQISRRHHTIPRFILRWFTTEPAKDNPAISRLDMRSGQITGNTIINEAVIGDFNRQSALPEFPPDAAEQTLAKIDGDCKPALERAIARESLTADDLDRILVFSMFQNRRTPRSRQWNAELMEHAQRVASEFHVSSKDYAQELKKAYPNASDEEISGIQDRMLADLREGRVAPFATADHEVGSMFLATVDAAAAIAPVENLAVLHAIDCEFVLADHPVCFYNPLAPEDRGIGWLKSEVIFPISRDTCLLFQTSRRGFAHVDVTAGEVDDLNLRSYANAEWTLYGSTQRWLQETRQSARRNRSKVSRYGPRKPRLVFFEGKQGQEPDSVEVYEPKGKIVRGFRPADRPAAVPIAKQPMSDRLRKEWAGLVRDDGPLPGSRRTRRT